MRMRQKLQSLKWSLKAGSKRELVSIESPVKLSAFTAEIIMSTTLCKKMVPVSLAKYSIHDNCMVTEFLYYSLVKITIRLEIMLIRGVSFLGDSLQLFLHQVSPQLTQETKPDPLAMNLTSPPPPLYRQARRLEQFGTAKMEMIQTTTLSVTMALQKPVGEVIKLCPCFIQFICHTLFILFFDSCNRLVGLTCLFLIHKKVGLFLL